MTCEAHEHVQTILIAYSKMRRSMNLSQSQRCDDYDYAAQLLTRHGLETVLTCFQGLTHSFENPNPRFNPIFCSRLSLLCERPYLVEINSDAFTWHSANHSADRMSSQSSIRLSDLAS